MNTPSSERFVGTKLICAAAGVSFALTACLLAAFAAKAQNTQHSNQPQNLIYSLRADDLFHTYCATCHGLDGRGGGPVASALKVALPDLTQLANNNGGPFPSARVRKVIAGDEILAAHGSREMPIWGPIFHQIENDQDFGNVRLENLVRYLQSIQSPRSSGPFSGAALYQQHCAACHGDNLKGTGPTPEPYRAPPDLTTLARRHGGKFPEEYVSDVLRNGVVIPAHGPAEMPIWGTEFRARGTDQAQVESRIAALAKYVESRQTK